MAAFCVKETLEEEVKKFPSSFDIDLSTFSKARIESMIKKLKDDRENTTKSKDEDLKISNFLSYLNFLLGHTDLALQLLDESLQREPDNIIANTNKGRILLENGEVSDVEEIISKLQDLKKRKDYEKRKCYAEADLAYAYSRSGPWYHQRAVEKFNRLVDIYSTEYAWQFGLGLTLHRRTHNFISQSDDIFNPEQHKKNIVRAAECFLTVAKQSDDKGLSAIAYARLGKTVHEIQKNKEWDVPKQIKEIDYISCYQEAAEKSPDDPSVLHLCGRLARYARNIDTSEKFLRKSIQINPTCQGYHHLALTLKRKVEMGRGQSTETSNIGTRHKSETRSDTTDSRYQQPREETNVKGLSSRGRFHKNKYQHTARNYHNHPNSSRHYQTKRQSRENEVSDQRKQRNLRGLINSPLKVKVYPENTHLLEAIELLEKTKELTEYPLNIEYDKGIIYRMLGQTEQAVRVFKQIVSKKKYLPTQTIMTNVYEQLGLCLLEISESEETQIDLKQKYKRDGQAHLSNAVQLQSVIVAQDPEFRNGWHSYPSLMELWNDTTDRKPKQLAVLHMLMGDHRDSIAIYKELSDGNQMDKKDCKQMLECYMELGKYEECVTLLSSWECTEIFTELHESMIFDVYINGALHANSMDNAQLAHLHFRRAFQVYGMFGKVDIDPSEAEEEEEAKEILILHSCPQSWRCSYPRDVGTILEGCTGLRYTVNTENVLANKITMDSMVSMMQKIPCIMIMTHESADHDRLYVNHALKINSKKTGTRVVVLSDDECNVPDVARTPDVSFIPLPLSDENTIRPDDDHKEWVKQFIEKLKPPM